MVWLLRIQLWHHVLKENKFIQIVSCNTHNASRVLYDLAFDKDTRKDILAEGKFLLMRRATDISQSKFIQQRKRLILEIPIETRDTAVESLWKIKRAIESLF